MNITVFGASGKVGRQVTALLLRRGHSVTALVHTHGLPDKAGLHQVKGDIYDRSTIEQALNGSQAVICALGSWGTPDKNVVSTAIEKIVPAMQKEGIRRIITVTGSATLSPGEKQPAAMMLTHALMNMLAPKILRDAEDHLSMLAASGLDWTVLRSPAMTGGRHIDYDLVASGGSLSIDRAAVVRAMADLIESGDWMRQAPIITRKH